MTLHDVHCFQCDWDGYTDEPNGECPDCGTLGSLELNDTSLAWDEWGDDDDWGVMDDDPGM